jgi:hypothetical protein
MINKSLTKDHATFPLPKRLYIVMKREKKIILKKGLLEVRFWQP